jgi:hypothetical protein
MCRRNVTEGEPELDQIGRITLVDISPIYQMENYGSDTGEELEFLLEVAENEEERQHIQSGLAKGVRRLAQRKHQKYTVALFTDKALCKNIF